MNFGTLKITYSAQTKVFTAIVIIYHFLSCIGMCTTKYFICEILYKMMFVEKFS